MPDAIAFAARTTPVAFGELRQALALAEAEHAAALAAGDAAAAVLVAAAATQWIVSDFGDLSLLARWLPRLAAGPAPTAGAAAAATALHAGGALAALLFVPGFGPADGDASLAAWRAMLPQADEAGDPNVLVASAEHAASWMTNHGQAAAFDELAACIEPWLARPGLDPLVRARWLFWLGTNHMFADRRADAERTWERARQAAGEQGWRWLGFHLQRVAIRPLLEDGRLAEAATRLDAMRALLDARRPLDLGDYHHLQAWLALAQGDARMALQHFGQAAEAGQRGALPAPAMLVYQSGAALSLVCDGREDEAEARVEGLGLEGSPLVVASMQLMRLLIGACKARRLGQGDYLARLEESLALARRHGLVRFFRPAPGLVAQLCADALDAGVEAAFAQRVVAVRRLAPPPRAGARWPWPVKLRVLGGFELEVDGAGADLSRRKPLDLLRLLAAAGPQPCAVDDLADRLWPEAEGDSARTSLDTTLHRLRKVLGGSERLTVADGRVGLERGAVWVDAWALADEVDTLEQRLGAAPSPESLREAGRRLLELYRGDFLGDGPQPPWALEARLRCHSRFERGARAVIAALRAAGLEAEAEPFARQALERAMLSEPLHEGLIELLVAQGRRADAWAAFGRCSELLMARLGRPPSARLRERALQA